MSDEQKPLFWCDRDLSVAGAIMYYTGRCYVRPLGRGVVLSDLCHEPHLDDVLPEGDYEIEIRVIRRVPSEDDQSAFDRLRVRSRGVETEILAAEGGSADDAEFAGSTGCPVPELLALAHGRQFFWVEFGGSRHWPRWQLGLPGLSDVLPILAKKEASGFSVALFFTTQTDVLSLDDIDDELPDVREDDSPLSLLRRCGPAAVPRVVRHAHRFGEQGGS